MTPIEIRRDAKLGLTISWNNGSTSTIPNKLLRRECPCAGCRERRGDGSHEKPLTGKKRSLTILESSIDQELDLKEIWAIGQYAIGMRWGDGHDSGIYTFDYLFQLGARES